MVVFCISMNFNLCDGCHRTWKTWENVHFVRTVSENLENLGKSVEKTCKSGKSQEIVFYIVCLSE